MNRFLAFGGFIAANQDSVGMQQILHGSPFGQKLRIGKNLELHPISGIVQNTFDGFGGTHRQGRFLDHDFVVFGNFGNLPGTQFNVFQVGGHSLSFAVGFGGRVHRNKNHLGFVYGFFNIGRKKQVSPPGFGNYFAQTRFINGNVVHVGIVPRSNSVRIQIDHRNLDVWTFLGNNGHGRPPNVSRSNATNFCDFHFYILCFLFSVISFLFSYIVQNPASMQS